MGQHPSPQEPPGCQRGKLFTRLIRETTVAARMGGADPLQSASARAVDAALAANMPKDTIERAIQRGAGANDGDNYDEIRYEGYGPGGTAVMVDCMTDNRNRTVAEVRHAFSKCGGNLGTDGSVGYLFRKVGLLSFDAADEDRLMEAALEAGAVDVVSGEDGSFEVLTDRRCSLVKDHMTAAGLPPDNADVTMRAEVNKALDGTMRRR